MFLVGGRFLLARAAFTVNVCAPHCMIGARMQTADCPARTGCERIVPAIKYARRWLECLLVLAALPTLGLLLLLSSARPPVARAEFQEGRAISPVAEAPEPVTVTLQLDVSAMGMDYPALDGTLTIQVLTAWEQVGTMRRYTFGEAEHQRALASIVTRAGLDHDIELVHVWLGQPVSMVWTSRALQLLLFLVLVGVTMDWHTLKEKGIYWRHLLDHYQLHDVRSIVGYLSPVAVAVFLIGQQFVSGEAQKAIVEIIKNLPRAIPTF